MIENLPISKSLQSSLLHDIIEPAYRRELKASSDGRFCWKRAARSFFWLANFCLLLAAICSGLQVLFKDSYWSILSGIANSVTLVLLNYSSIASHEQIMVTQDANELLKMLKLPLFPVQSHETFPIIVQQSTNEKGEEIKDEFEENVTPE